MLHEPTRNYELSYTHYVKRKMAGTHFSTGPIQHNRQTGCPNSTLKSGSMNPVSRVYTELNAAFKTKRWDVDSGGFNGLLQSGVSWWKGLAGLSLNTVGLKIAHALVVTA